MQNKNTSYTSLIVNASIFSKSATVRQYPIFSRRQFQYSNILTKEEYIYIFVHPLQKIHRQAKYFAVERKSTNSGVSWCIKKLLSKIF